MKALIRFVSLTVLVLIFSTVSSAQTPPYNRTVIVPSTGNTTADGAALISALANLSPAPSFGNRWLIKLEPGIYNVGTTPVVMRQFVDIEGSGVEETLIQGSVAPPPGFLLGGLVEGASRSEIRSLTINCLSDALHNSCQAMSLNSASPRLSQMRILVQGSGTGSHWGIRTSNSGPKLDDVEISVDVSSSFSNFGIVYGDTSTLNIQRSNITARNASFSNFGITIKENLGWSPMRDSSVTGIGGTVAAGIMYLESSTSQNLLLDNVQVSGYAASSESFGIGSDSITGAPRIWYRAGRVYGATDGINVPTATVYVINSEIQASRYLVFANHVRIGSTWLRDGGTVVGAGSEICAGVFFTVPPDVCP